MNAKDVSNFFRLAPKFFINLHVDVLYECLTKIVLKQHVITLEINQSNITLYINSVMYQP
jgi:hypothetical protein